MPDPSLNPVVNGRFRIADIQVEPALDEIYKDGKVIKLEPRAMRLLVCLADRAGQVLSVEELLDLVWKDVIVSPDSVYAAIAALRRTLGDDSKNPTYISNVVRRGYRLVAPVSAWEPTAPFPVGGPDIPIPPPRTASFRLAAYKSNRLPRYLFLLALVLVAAVAVLAYRGRLSTHVRAKAETPSSATVLDRSVAVLPFLDLSEKKDEEYFADGMSEELINLLTQVTDLRVPARTSSFYFKGKQATLPEIARTLGVSHILEGSVRKSGDTLRITAQLVRADTGYHEWSETFDRPMADVFKVQDEIAAKVVRALKASLLSTARSAPPTSNSAAYTLYLRAQAMELGGGDDDYALAEKYIRQSLALDPNFAAAWADLAQIKVADEGWSSEDSYKETCAEGRQAIDQALRLNSGLADSHRVLANFLYLCEWDWTGAEMQYQRALEIEPNRADTLRQYATMAWFRRQPNKAIELAHKAVERDPLDAWSYNALALAQNQAGQISESVESWQKALELDPTVDLFVALLTNALLANGKPADALAEIEREPDDQMKQMNLPFIYDALGRRDDADRAIAAFEAKYGAHDPVSLGEFYACRNDASRALGFLERGVALHFVLTDVANRQACFKTLEGNSRYRELMRRMNLP